MSKASLLSVITVILPGNKPLKACFVAETNPNEIKSLVFLQTLVNCFRMKMYGCSQKKLVRSKRY